MKFCLSGEVSWAVGSCHDGRSQSINEEFDAPNVEAAIEKAREIVQGLHKECSHRTDYGLHATLCITKPVWETHFRDAEDAILARKARPASEAHFEESTLA